MCTNIQIELISADCISMYRCNRFKTARLPPKSILVEAISSYSATSSHEPSFADAEANMHTERHSDRLTIAPTTEQLHLRTAATIGNLRQSLASVEHFNLIHDWDHSILQGHDKS